MILDQTGWHTTQKLPQLANITLLALPEGSAELNPGEQVWQQLRERSLANRCYDSYATTTSRSCIISLRCR
ncbi:transposase [Neobacillus sp. YIM B02564]|uniref:Transposase n=1 Tax=Neobacillus paridis TaxID=2803862 RepID=A0ABS1TP55_9BACI|nr:transposase [Neobacillus paridis]